MYFITRNIEENYRKLRIWKLQYISLIRSYVSSINIHDYVHVRLNATAQVNTVNVQMFDL